MELKRGMTLTKRKELENGDLQTSTVIVLAVKGKYATLSDISRIPRIIKDGKYMKIHPKTKLITTYKV